MVIFYRDPEVLNQLKQEALEKEQPGYNIVDTSNQSYRTNGIMNPAFESNYLQIAENVKKKQQEFTTIAPGATQPFYPENYASNISLIDRAERFFGVEQPITEGLGVNYLSFEGKDLSPQQELDDIGFNQENSSYNTFKKMVYQGLVSDNFDTGEVFNPVTKGGTPDAARILALYRSGDYFPSTNYTQSIGSKVTEFRKYELGRQNIESKLAGDNSFIEKIGTFASGFLGGNPKTQGVYRGAKLSGQNVTFDPINEEFSKAIPVNQDPTENAEFMSLMEEYDPDRYDRIMSLKRNMELIKDPNYDPALAQATIYDLIGRTVDLGDGRKLVTINSFSANPEDSSVYSDIAAPGSSSYVAGQFAQLGIEFIPFIGTFSGVTTSAVRLSGKGVTKIFGKNADQIKVVCSSPCKLSVEGKKAINKAVDEGKLTIKQARQLEAQMKLKAESQNVGKAASEFGKTKNLNTYDKAVADQTRDISVTIAKPENKKIFEYLDNLKQEGNPLLLRKLLDDLELPSGSKERIKNIVRKYYPNTFAKLNPEELRKVQSDRAKETYAAKRANEDVLVPTPRRLETGKGNEKISQVDFPKGMEEKYIVDLKDIYNNPKSNGTNTMLAEKYFGEATPYTIAQVERVNNFLIRQQNLIKPIADPSASGKLRQARIKQAEKYLNSEELEIVRRQDRQVTIANKYYAQNPEKILENETFMELLNAKLVNGVIDTKDPITLTKAKELTQKGLFDIFHISPVSSEKRNIMFPGNILISPARINQGFNNAVEAFFKKNKNSKQPEVIKNKKAISDFYKKFGLTLETVDGRIGAELSPAINRETNKLTSIDNVFEKMNVEQIIDSSLYVSKQELDKIFKESKVGGEFVPLGAKKAETYNRKKFQEGSQEEEEDDFFTFENIQAKLAAGEIPGTAKYAIDQSVKNTQQDILNIYSVDARKSFDEAYKRIKLYREDIAKTLEEKLNPPQPVKFKFSDLPKLVTESPLIEASSFLNAPGGPQIAGLEVIEFLYNGIRSGEENDIEMKEKYPGLYAVNESFRVGGAKSTPKEADYISAVSEVNRVIETGVTNFAFNVGDLLFTIPDAVLPTEFTDELKRRYENADLSKPETFVGQIASVALEFGIPGGIAFKLINRFRKFTAARTGGKVNLFTQKTYALEGLPKLGVQVSNVAKRVGSGMVSFGAGDFIAGGPYNTISEMFDDPLLTSKYVGEYEDTTGMSGKKRVAANFRNRLRFGAEGAMIGGLFPLAGPVLGAVGKKVLLKPALAVGSIGLKAVNVPIKAATYLASKDDVVLPSVARGVGAFGKFLGKDILARVGATIATGGKALIPSLKGNYGQLPELSKWRMFDVTSKDPLEAGLKRVDNFLKWFRDSGNQIAYSFNLDGTAERFIKSKAREIEKYIDAIEVKAYDLASGFLGRYNKGFTSPAGEKHLMDQVHEYLRGNLKLSKIEPELQELAKALKDEFTAIKKTYFKELPEGSGLRNALESNLDKYIRMSFATFTNPNYNPSSKVFEDATDFMVNIISKNEDFLEAAVKGVPVTEQAAAIREFARKNVDNIISIGKREGTDPINALNTINREIIRDDQLFLNTGEELPAVIRKLLGQETNLRSSVMTTTGSLVSQTANLKSFKEFARHGLENGYLFTTRAEALAAGVTNPTTIGDLPGLGQMKELMTSDKGGPIGLYASNELRRTVEGTGGMLDNLLQNSFYQSAIAYKAAVQTGKTVFSPATQTRNFGSAGFFPMHVGHIGGSASVTDAFKITLDDIFGAGRTVNEVDLIKRISRKIELGVLDENIVASELGAILKDIKAGKLQSLGKLAERVEKTPFYKQATRVYAGGDNVWKWYGHEYYMSQLKGGFKNVQDVTKFFNLHGIEFNPKNIMTGSMKTLDEGIEEAAAYLLRETYPTYSKVPEFIKAIRKLPIGNFVSFTSEILRTGFATSSIAMKHIASNNQALREMGYRMLSGQAITLGGMTAGVSGLGHALTNVTPTQVDVYKEYFAPDYMKYSSLIPVSNVENGTFKVFDFSRYNPYDIIVASGRQLMKVADRNNYSKELVALQEQYAQLDPSSDAAKALRSKMKELKIRMKFGPTLDPDKIQTNTLKTYLEAVGPLYDSVTGTFFGIPIGAEAFIEAYTGKTRQGSSIWSKGMTDTEIFDRAMGHFFKTIEPGLISSGRKLFHAARGDVSGVGQPLEVVTEIFKLMGGSNVTIDIPGSLDFKISSFQQAFREAKVGKKYFDTKNFRSRGPEQLAKEYNEQNEQLFRQQYEFYKAAMAAIDSGLMTRNQIMLALKKRIAPGSEGIPTKVIMLMNGRFTPLSYGREGLKSRKDKILRNNKDLDPRIFNYQYFIPLGMLEAIKSKWKGVTFKAMEREELSQTPIQRTVETPTQIAAEPEVAPLPDTGAPVVQPEVANVDQTTGLTTTETALLSPGEQAIRQRQRGVA